MLYDSFDYTNGLEAEYMVNIHRWNVSDQCYFSNYYEAKKFYERICRDLKEMAEKYFLLEDTTTINLWDIAEDVCKEQVQF